MSVTIQQLINRCARSGQPVTVPIRQVNFQGPVDLPEGLRAEGDDKAFSVWFDGGQRAPLPRKVRP